MKKINRIGETKINNQGLKMTIIEYNRNDNIVVGFEDSYTTKSQYILFQKGKIANPNFRGTYGVGFLGVGTYECSKDSKLNKTYTQWFAMFQRCYSEAYHEKEPTYKDCTVCDEWHNFQNFAKWCSDNYYEIELDKMCLDKDILSKGNKTYSPETCVFVPQIINSLFIKSDSARGEYPIGVTKRPNGSFQARLSKSTNSNNKRVSLGCYKTTDEAFNSYKKAKEEYIKELADKYKDGIPNSLYQAMYRYEVAITD